MAVTLSNFTNATGKNITGESGDTKPTRTIPVEDADGNLIYAAINDLYLEADTGDFYYYVEPDGVETWKKIGWNAQ